MENYENLIYDNLSGNSPKEKYEALLLMQKQNIEYQKENEMLLFKIQCTPYRAALERIVELEKMLKEKNIKYGKAN